MNKTNQMLGTVRLSNAVFYAHHGVMQEEHRIGGRYEVDVSMKLDFANASITDSLNSTVDYATVYKLIQALMMENKFYLIEKIAVLIAQELLSQFDIVQETEVVVRKVNPPLGGTCDFAEAVFLLKRT